MSWDTKFTLKIRKINVWRCRIGSRSCGQQCSLCATGERQQRYFHPEHARRLANLTSAWETLLRHWKWGHRAPVLICTIFVALLKDLNPLFWISVQPPVWETLIQIPYSYKDLHVCCAHTHTQHTHTHTRTHTYSADLCTWPVIHFTLLFCFHLSVPSPKRSWVFHLPVQARHLLNAKYWHMAFHLLASLPSCGLSIMIFPDGPQLLNCLHVCFRVALCHPKESEHVDKCSKVSISNVIIENVEKQRLC